jgi:hypothetical protein
VHDDRPGFSEGLAIPFRVGHLYPSARKRISSIPITGDEEPAHQPPSRGRDLAEDQHQGADADVDPPASDRVCAEKQHQASLLARTTYGGEHPFPRSGAR